MEDINPQTQPQNGVAFLKIKKLSDKAVIPSRGSHLAAGYDLSSAVEIKVPARGKALVATDLSIAIPQGTYARVGKSLVFILKLMLYRQFRLNGEYNVNFEEILKYFSLEHFVEQFLCTVNEMSNLRKF
ncbi:hypothetical protein KSS87_017424 [Heliosperma pusillum]|nr:hypothetical protein KSS87_017424 [Heliosperma pusillum]